ncbi:DUF1758 domain-containing protein [Trichonephila clavipes]|nr:DUF1758 domain-containing protein [Trichonephila clavipes]
MAWERKRNTETDAKGSRTLEHLMTFLRLEVQEEEMVQLAKSSFGTPIRKRDSPTERVKPTINDCISSGKFRKVLRQWEDLNIIERVPEVELNNECHYLPHRPVIKLDSATTKIRPVFDASDREKGKPSLNDCLYKGVNLIELIPDILDRFRIYPVGIVADIEKAFLMLSVAPKDRDYLRFFSPCNEKQLVYRHCRVVFGVSSSPYLLNASIMYLLENCNSESMWQVKVSVDKHSGETFILGIIWDLDNDVLKCCTNFDSLTCEVKITKRLVLSTVQKVFDPIGMLTPSTLLPKLLLQEIWKMKKVWDQELPQNIVNKFMKWFNEIQILKDVTVPRCMKIDIFTELHVFVDASKGSYAGCVFARSIVDSRVCVILVRAKSKVASLKLLSIPRLELMACCVGARLVNSILKALNMPDLKVTLWSDSTTALWWIKEYGNWSVFVANRVKEIRQLTQIQSWKYVPGNMNIADLLSRGCSPRQMLNSRWWEGPSWLKQNSEYWPDGEISCEPQEVKCIRLPVALSTLQVTERSSSVSSNFEGELPRGNRGLPTSLLLPPTSREDLRIDGYLKYTYAAKALHIYKHPCLLRDSNSVPTALQSDSITTIPVGRLDNICVNK